MCTQLSIDFSTYTKCALSKTIKQPVLLSVSCRQKYNVHTERGRDECGWVWIKLWEGERLEEKTRSIIINTGLTD